MPEDPNELDFLIDFLRGAKESHEGVLRVRLQVYDKHTDELVRETEGGFPMESLLPDLREASRSQQTLSALRRLWNEE